MITFWRYLRWSWFWLNCRCFRVFVNIQFFQSLVVGQFKGGPADINHKGGGMRSWGGYRSLGEYKVERCIKRPINSPVHPVQATQRCIKPQLSANLRCILGRLARRMIGRPNSQRANSRQRPDGLWDQILSRSPLVTIKPWQPFLDSWSKMFDQLTHYNALDQWPKPNIREQQIRNKQIFTNCKNWCEAASPFSGTPASVNNMQLLKPEE